MIFKPIFNEHARLQRLEYIKTVILDFKKSRNKRLRKKLFEDILNYLQSHYDCTGGFETPFLDTANEMAQHYGVTRRTVERWKKRPDFPHNGEIFDTWAIDCWLRKHDKLTEDFKVKPFKKFE